MKSILPLIIALCFAIILNAQSTNQNYTQTIVPKEAYTLTEVNSYLNSSSEIRNKKLHNGILYYDGLGKLKQSIDVGDTPLGNDLIVHHEYDQFDRVEKSYLPFPSTQNTGNFISGASLQTKSYYKNKNRRDNNPYTQKRFEFSPLHRIEEYAEPGDVWALRNNYDLDRTTKIEYGTNALEEVRKYEIDQAGNIIVSYYEPNTLKKTITRNENWNPNNNELVERANTETVFRDKQGRTIAKMKYRYPIVLARELNITSNVYDNYGNLRIIITPEVKPEDGVAWDELEFYCYQYKYDKYNRKIAQKTPGKDWEYIVYDNIDQPILVQDGNMKEKNLWLFTKYDTNGRIVYTGKYSNSKSREDLQKEVDAFFTSVLNKAITETRTDIPINLSGVTLNYTNNAFPKTDITEILSINYYDDYSFTDIDKPLRPTNIEGQDVTLQTKGLPTAGWVRILGTDLWSKTYTYYDEKARPIRVYGKNHFGGITYTDNKLDFTGKATHIKTRHQRLVTDPIINIVDRYEYDNGDRLVDHYQTVNDQPEERIVSHKYDEINQIVQKKVGNGNITPEGDGLQNIDYTYNIRGWLTQVNNTNALSQKDLFAYKLNHYNHEGSPRGHNRKYDGTITQTVWKTQLDTLKKTYNYRYNSYNWLEEAFLYDLPSKKKLNDFNIKLRYYLDGNIETLKRNNKEGILIDDVSISYVIKGYDPDLGRGIAGNQIYNLHDSKDSYQGVIDKNVITQDNPYDYKYDKNANVIQDFNKGISYTYNHLDLVDKITFDDGNTLSFTYDASGRKLAKKYTLSGNVVQTDYLSGFQYQNNQLQFFQTPEGYFEVNTNVSSNLLVSNSTLTTGANATTRMAALLDGDYVYQFKDHLGNIRLSYSDRDGDGMIDVVRNGIDIDGDGDNHNEIIQAQDYDPLGYELDYGPDHPYALINGQKNLYKYQGKELLEENELDYYDFGSRIYDPSLGRWWSADPQNQFGSPYLAMGNNWPNSIDPDGEFVFAAIGIGAIIGSFSAAMSGQIQNPGDFFIAAGIGAAAGASGAGIGSVVSSGLGVSATLGGSIANGALAGASGGFTGGFISGAGNAFVNGANFGNGLEAGLETGSFGAATGAVLGGIDGAIRYHKALTPFRKGNKNLNIQNGDAVPATDEFLKTAQEAWFPDAPMDNLRAFTTENVPQKYLTLMTNNKAGAMTLPLLSKGNFSGNSKIFFNPDFAFVSAKELFFTMGHEFIHASQHAALIGKSYSIYTKNFHELMEYHGYNYGSYLGSSNNGAFNRGSVRALMQEFPEYFKSFNFSNYSWTKTAKFVYPFN